MKKAALALVAVVILLIVGRGFFYSPCDASWMSGTMTCECLGKKIDVTDRAKAAVDAAPAGETRCLGIVTSQTDNRRGVRAPAAEQRH